MKRLAMGLAASVFVLGLGTQAWAEDPVIDEVLQILEQRGLIDASKHAELASRNAAYEEEHRSLLGRIEWSGDFRARLENFWFDQDELGVERANRTRGRYRLRIQGKAPINDFTEVVFRLASGEGDHRSTNRTLGKGDDFDPDSIFIDRAYAEFKAPRSWIGESSSLKARVGKMGNPFLWKNGKDYMLWDHDINPEGGAVMLETRPREGIRAYLNTGFFVIDENGTSKDPHLTAVQGGADFHMAEDLEIGLRGSFYSFASLNSSFFARDTALGAVTDDDYRVLEIAGYLRYRGIESWPLLLFGHYARNLDAGRVSSFTGSDEDTGWGVGFEVGDKKKFVKLGFGYYALEANFFPAAFTDSDLFDGFTNREGFTIYGSRQLMPGTDLNLTLFKSDELRGALPLFARSAANADRIRLQTDIVIKF